MRDARMSEESRVTRWIMDPLRGNTSFGSVLGWYGVVGSLVYSALGLLVDVESERAMRVYAVGGLIYSVYVTVATYRCAVSLRSPFAGTWSESPRCCLSFSCRFSHTWPRPERSHSPV